MTIADAVWVATAQLHQNDSSACDFSVQEIIKKATSGKLVGFTPGLQVHVSKHCVANKSPNSERHRMLFATARGRRRLFKPGDPFHADRSKGKIHPERRDLPNEYRNLIDWYDSVYFVQSNQDEGNGSGAMSSPAGPRSKQVSDTAVPGVAFVSAAGVLVIPEDLRRELGIREGTRIGIYREKDHLILQPITEAFIESLAGCCKGGPSMVEAREREHRMER